ncbi:MAG: isoleucine--tRNA ligase [Streptosporangiales bacterium]|nr:isoleucine--tRNA ligase [Streptosporangiales bacterium]
MGTQHFRPLPTQVDLPAIEHEVLERWEKRRIFERSLEQTADGTRWVFNEGPPTANGLPGVHHVEARAFKDLYPRFKTMQGYHVPRKAGWDCHGLPVEIAVERELGFSGKPDIERYGIAEFNAKCRESVLRHVDSWEQLTTRMAYWTDLSDPYRTMDVSYVESVWWSLKQIFDRGLLEKDFRITPYCPRCGTGLSDHELGQPGVYQQVTDPGITVRFPLLSGPVADRHGADAVDLLIWTTTPWTLVSNALVAVDPELSYAVARPKADTGQRPVLVAESLVPSLLGEDWEVVETYTGAELERSAYRRPLDLFEVPNAHFVAVGDFVTAEEGTTGLVHCSPSFGADDFALCRAYGIPVVNPIDLTARFLPHVPLVGGMYFKEADATLLQALREAGALFKEEPYDHSYPHCWRCHTALIYYALPAWYIRTTAVKDRLLAENELTDWHPDSIKHGRYGEWLRNNVDWALSRDRYWGTPLPIWTCRGEHLTCVASRAELGELVGRDLTDLDPHRPYIDEVTFACPQCGETATRVPQVIDAWYDSGSMAFAQWGYPHLPGSDTDLDRTYPANYICEAIDQTRGWFYSLMAVGTLVFDKSSYQTVLCLGHIVDAEGRKMSKHLGNVLDPMTLMEQHGADGLRWLMLCVGNPWSTRRVGHELIDDVVRRVLLTYWNTASFLVLYANAAADGPDGRAWTPELAADASAPADRPLLDRWALSELYRTVDEVTAALAEFDSVRAGRRLTEFVDDLSNWYVRRSRRRFWQGFSSPECASAFATLYECVETVTRLLAPFVPFITDQVWEALRGDRTDAADSVHLASWPAPRQELVDEQLSAQMALVRRLVELGRSTRSSSGVRTRQPLGRALVSGPGWADLPEPLRAEVAAELNVAEVQSLGDQQAELVDYLVKPNFRTLGRRFGKQTPRVAYAISAADPAGLVAASRSGAATVPVDGEQVQLDVDDLIVTEAPRAGWAVASEHGCTVALDLEITPQLRRAGLVRESVRAIQEARKAAGFEVSDRIALVWQADDADLQQALRNAATAVAQEVLAETSTEHDGSAPDGHHNRDETLGLTTWLRKL